MRVDNPEQAIWIREVPARDSEDWLIASEQGARSAALLNLPGFQALGANPLQDHIDEDFPLMFCRRVATIKKVYQQKADWKRMMHCGGFKPRPLIGLMPYNKNWPNWADPGNVFYGGVFTKILENAEWQSSLDSDLCYELGILVEAKAETQGDMIEIVMSLAAAVFDFEQSRMRTYEGLIGGSCGKDDHLTPWLQKVVEDHMLGSRDTNLWVSRKVTPQQQQPQQQQPTLPFRPAWQETPQQQPNVPTRKETASNA